MSLAFFAFAYWTIAFAVAIAIGKTFALTHARDDYERRLHWAEERARARQQELDDMTLAWAQAQARIVQLETDNAYMEKQLGERPVLVLPLRPPIAIPPAIRYGQLFTN